MVGKSQLIGYRYRWRNTLLCQQSFVVERRRHYFFLSQASIPVLYERLLSESNKRPLVTGKTEEELKEFIAKHLFDRSYFYHQATHNVSVDGKTSQAVAEEMLQLLN